MIKQSYRVSRLRYVGTYRSCDNAGEYKSRVYR